MVAFPEVTHRHEPLPDDPDAEVVELCRELVRIDSTNSGPGHGKGEGEVADAVARLLGEIGVEARRHESAPGRVTLVADWVPEGTDTTRPHLLLHGHSDVVPAVAEDWSVDPFAGVVKDGCLWGRGTLDMKGFLAMVLSAVRARHRRGEPPSRPIRFILFADEECSGDLGSTWLGRHHPEAFDGVSEAVSEVGGFSVTTPSGRRVYVVQTAEKALWWFTLTATGSAGHGSMRNPDNAVTRLAAALERIGNHVWPDAHHPAQERFLAEYERLWGVDLDRDDLEAGLAPLGPLARMVAASSSHTVTPTVLRAGYKANVIPTTASAELDARMIPGLEAEFEEALRDLAGSGTTITTITRKPGAQAPFEGPVVSALQESLAREDPGCVVAPYLNCAGTDAKGFAVLPDGRRIHCYGATPLRLPAGFDFVSLFHGVDERVPLSALRFGARVVDGLLARA